MSAWLCTNRHINFLAKACEAHGLLPAVPDAVEQFAVQLKLENLRSLHARYGDRIPSEIETATDGDISDLAGMIEVRDFVHKQARCFDYQTCEHAGWGGSPVQLIVQKLIDATADPDNPSALSNEHPWGIK